MKLPNDPLAKPDNAQKPLYVVPFHTLKEAKLTALEVAQVFQLRFDNRRSTISFPAFDLRFTSYPDPALHSYRNIVDVAELDGLLLRYRDRTKEE